MNEVIQSISNREIAASFWLLALVAFVTLKRQTRESLKGLAGSFFNPMILVPLLLGAIYATGEIFLIKCLGLWSLANLKTSILWVITFAFVAMFEVATAKNRKTSLEKITREVLAITGVFTFIVELYSFPLLVEIAALPFVAFIAMTSEVAKRDPSHAKVASCLGNLLTAIGLSYLGCSLWLSIVEWQQTATAANSIEFLLPLVLSLGFLPFLYGWQIYVAYNSTFATISIYGLDSKLLPYARWLAATRIRGDVELLERWRKSIQSVRPADKSELKHSLTALLALRAREASPPIAQPKDGWSPYLAMQFMSDLGIDTGHYHHSFDDDWFASSPLREIGGNPIFQNNIAYYIDGKEHAATALKIKLNVNDPERSRAAEDMFIIHAMHLLEQAVSRDAAERHKMQIAALEEFEADIPFGSVNLTRADFVGGIKGGYSRKFEVRRGHEAH